MAKIKKGTSESIFFKQFRIVGKLPLLHYYYKEVLVRIFFKLISDIKKGDEVKNSNFEGKIAQIESNQLIIEQVDGSLTGILMVSLFLIL